MTTPQKKWTDLTGDEKVALVELRKERQAIYGNDSELVAWNRYEANRRRRIKKHTNAILKLRAS